MPEMSSLRALACACCIAIGLTPAGLMAQGPSIERAPAFEAEALLELPARNWITNGGNLYNQRYSTLDQINRDNIDDVRAVWRVSLNGSGMEPARAQAHRKAGGKESLRRATV